MMRPFDEMSDKRLNLWPASVVFLQNQVQEFNHEFQNFIYSQSIFVSVRDKYEWHDTFCPPSHPPNQQTILPPTMILGYDILPIYLLINHVIFAC